MCFIFVQGKPEMLSSCKPYQPGLGTGMHLHTLDSALRRHIVVVATLKDQEKAAVAMSLRHLWEND